MSVEHLIGKPQHPRLTLTDLTHQDSGEQIQENPAAHAPRGVLIIASANGLQGGNTADQKNIFDPVLDFPYPLLRFFVVCLRRQLAMRADGW